ncbi:HNH endonuclease signature motif containing protein [Armatimonas rosea]|uniref:HNH endonuclease n=1 Tax=Armatimonas rosea TaxID=685828 RepID=UPI0016206B63
MTVDHYQPLSAQGTDDLENLVYACFRCNLYKGDFWGGNHPESQARVLHPRQDRLEIHFTLDSFSGLLVAITSLGGFHIALQHLNREALVFRRREEVTQLAYQTLLEEMIVRQQELLQLYEERLRFLEENL